MTPEEYKQIENLIGKKLDRAALSGVQRRQMAKLIGIAVVGLAGVGVLALMLDVNRLADSKAISVSPGKAAQVLMGDADFVRTVSKGVGPLPTGAVVAFDGDGGCPSGWAPYAKGAGRVVLGAGQGVGLTLRAVGERGGSEVLADIPSHQHSVPITATPVAPQGAAEGDGSRQPGTVMAYDPSAPVPTSVAGAFAVSTLPPYIALLLCRKE